MVNVSCMRRVLYMRQYLSKEVMNLTTGERLKRLRKDLGLSADELGAMIGKDRSTIYRYERGDIQSATIDVVPRLARALQTTPQYILGWDDKPTFYWVNPSRAMEISDLAEQWYNWTEGQRWTEKELDVFLAQAQYFKRIKGTDEYEAMMQFLITFYRQLNK